MDRECPRIPFLVVQKRYCLRQANVQAHRYGMILLYYERKAWAITLTTHDYTNGVKYCAIDTKKVSADTERTKYKSAEFPNIIARINKYSLLPLRRE